ncbi:MAG: NAD(P)/FAD-dependent oxidoreductase [Flammeovirgaceae bacterium]|nr:NAD(P)/FAD-dependent oxidoreductase [Flammeovirgaceae bacterium]
MIVIGGGAAGFFGAINLAEQKPGSHILILEKSTKLLTKVKVSGGGRCNVTHQCISPAELSQHYPRGQKQLKSVFHRFQATDTVTWFKKHGVEIKTEADGRMFPTTNNSQTIIDCFLELAKKYNIEIKLSSEVERIEKAANNFIVFTKEEYQTKNILVATGGYNKPENYEWLKNLGHEIINPIPSLFTFNNPEKQFAGLMGVAVQQAEVRIAGTKFSQQGAVLITHWGLSGPAVIKLSAWAAVYLHQNNYTFTALVNWTGKPEIEVRKHLTKLKQENSKKTIITSSQFTLPKRLWEALCIQAGVDEEKIWAEIPNKTINKLIELLYACPFAIKGKTTFKEEFVTCGGVSLADVDLSTMQSKKVPGLYFAGEALDVDGETGGFNFQSAWSTAWVAASHLVLEP